MKQIFLVEDELGHALLIKHAFKRDLEAWDLIVFTTLKAAREGLARESPDLLLVDFMLSDGHGNELLPRSGHNLPYPVIILTSYGSEGIAVEIMKRGALDYVVKSSRTFAEMPNLARRSLREWGHIIKHREAEQRLHLALESTGNSIWEWDILNRKLICDDYFAYILGYLPSEININFDWLIANVHPESISEVKEILEIYQETASEYWEAEYRIRAKTGEWRWIEVRGKMVTYQEDSIHAKMVGIQRDITERKVIEETLKIVDKISDKITSMLDLQQILNIAAQLLHESLGYNIVGIYTIEGNHLTLKAKAGENTFPDGYKIKMNKSVLKQVDNEAKEIINNSGEFTQQSLVPDIQSTLSISIQSRGKTIGVVEVLSPNRNAFSENDVMAIEILADQLAIAIQNAQFFEQVVESQKQLQELAQQTLSAQEVERQHLSRELHDEIGQSMIGIKIGLGLLLSEYSSEASSAQNQIKDIVSLVDTTMSHIRAVAQDLRPPALDAIGLEETLEGYCFTFAHRTQLDIKYTVEAKLPLLPEGADICLYRILQEALTNVVKHAAASHVTVVLDYVDSYVKLSIIDNGKGFDVKAATKSQTFTKSIGLIGMKERLELLNGHLQIISHLHQGTQLVATVPCKVTL